MSKGQPLTAISCARKLVDLIDSLPDFNLEVQSYRSYGHMGATLTDAGLQAGINYLNVVAPRVNRILLNWPEARTTSCFFTVIRERGLKEVLSWTHPEKPRRIHDMTVLLTNYQVETEAELAQWLTTSENRKLLQEIRGVGPKTVNYLWGLVGGSTIAVDRHLMKFASWAGVLNRDYDEMEIIFRFTADLLNVDYCFLDRIIWNYVINPSNTSKHG